MSRLWSPLAIASVLAALFVLGAVACAGEGDLGTYNDDENAQDNQNDENDEPDNQEPDNQNDDEPQTVLTELQQWCAVAGQSDDGELTSLHCTGPHDISGFEASDGDHRWQPGGFQVIVE